uniref:Eye-specific diacylglycerol kinase n=1 Tax=Anopheles quadriannulatus TaxID=34691 RepID=A0A182XEG2_ANOQN
MHRLRNTFTRSRTPTGAEMKTQSSLEVPKQVRSASFDEIQLEAQRASGQQRSLSVAGAGSSTADDGGSGGMPGVGSLLLQVPQTAPGQRSRSFDLAGSASDEGSAVAAAFLDVPKRFQRRKSSSKTPPPCIHCLYLEEYRRLIGVEQRLYYDSEEYQAYVDYTSSSCSSGDDDDDDDGDDEADEAGGEEDGTDADAAGTVLRVRGTHEEEEEQVEGGAGTSINRVAAVGLAGPSGGPEETRTHFTDGYYDYDYYYDDDEDEEEDETEEAEPDEDNEQHCTTTTTTTIAAIATTKVEQKKEAELTFGLEAPAYDYASLFQRVSPRRRPRVDGEGSTLLSPPASVASPCRITLTLSPTKPDEEEDQQQQQQQQSQQTELRTAEIALMLPVDGGSSELGAVGEAHDTRPPPLPVTVEPAEDGVEPPAPSRTRRRSISRQEAIIVEPTGSSLENVSNASESRPTTPPRPVPDIHTSSDELDCQQQQQQRDRAAQRGRAASMGPILAGATVRPAPPQESPPPSAGPTVQLPPSAATSQAADFVRDIYLQVPDLKRDRAASVDSCFTKVTGAKTEELQPPPDGACLNLLAVPSSGAVRSRSVDIVLPTEEQARYKALALAGPAGSAGQQGGGGSGGGPVAHLAPGIIRG